MAFFNNFSATAQVLIGCAVTYALYSISISITTWRQRQAIKREKGCQPVPWAANQVDRIFGVDLFLRTVKAVKSHTMLATVQQAFASMDVKTMQFVTLGVHMFRTIEPENLKTILAVDHTKWALPVNRKAGMALPLQTETEAYTILFRSNCAALRERCVENHYLLSDELLTITGIFTNDGAAWQHSRDMLRPNFVRSQVGDVLTFEKHVSQLIRTITESPTVDLSELFFLLSMDSATV